VNSKEKGDTVQKCWGSPGVGGGKKKKDQELGRRAAGGQGAELGGGSRELLTIEQCGSIGAKK